MKLRMQKIASVFSLISKQEYAKCIQNVSLKMSSFENRINTFCTTTEVASLLN